VSTVTTRIVAAAAGGFALLLVALVTVVGGGSVAVADPPEGGCAVTVDHQPATVGSATGAAGESTRHGVTLTADQMAAARIIAGVGKGLGVHERGIAIALGTAMQESSLNPSATNGRSVGLFQQQGALYADVDRTDVAASSAAFYRQLLTRVPQYADPNAVSFADAAQTVQASGAGPVYYARWEAWATTLAGQLNRGTLEEHADGSTSAVVCRSGGGTGPITVTVHGLSVDLPTQAGITGALTFPTPAAATAAAAALSYLGTPYAWGGGDLNGPTLGQRDGGIADTFGDYRTIGFDCSGLTRYAYAQAGITLPRTSREQQSTGAPVPWAQALPGDLLFWGTPVHHVALYLGQLNGQHYMVEAPHSGTVVSVSLVRAGGDFTGTAVRPY